MKPHGNPWKYSVSDNQLQQMTCLWIFSFISLRWNGYLQYKATGSLLLSVLPCLHLLRVQAKQFLWEFIYLLYAGKPCTLQPRNISGISEVIKTDGEQDTSNWFLLDYSPKLKSTAAMHSISTGSLPILLMLTARDKPLKMRVYFVTFLP